MERKPPMDRCACDDPSYLPSRVMKRAAEEIDKYKTAESMTVRHDHDDLSSGPSTQPRFDRFPAKCYIIRFLFFINSSKNLVFGVRLLIIFILFVRLLIIFGLFVRLLVI